MKIALVGNQNSGKSTFFNALTKGNARVGNWSGITVSVTEGIGKRPGIKDAVIIDLPGTYSLEEVSLDEGIAIKRIREADFDVIVNVIDARQLRRSFYLTSQLLALQIPMIVVINKLDTLVESERIDFRMLSQRLAVPVIGLSAKKSSDVNELIHALHSATINHNHVVSNVKEREEFALQLAKEVQAPLQPYVSSLDRILTHKVFGLVIFFAVLYVIFWLSQVFVGPYLADLLNALLLGGNIVELVTFGWVQGVEIVGLYGWLQTLLSNSNVAPILQSLVLEGMIGGSAAVLGFLPLIMVLFFFITLLEDSGYMARVAMMLNRYFYKIGLEGKSVLPLFIGTACSIPAVMATRTIRDERHRTLTVMLTPFIPCGAKVPVIALFAGVYFSTNPFVAPAMYLLSIFVIFWSGLLLKKLMNITLDDDAFFMIELPRYQKPSLTYAFQMMNDRARAFIINAATIIILMNTFIWFTQTYSWQLQLVQESAPQTSILATLASPFAFLLIPLGFGVWQFAAASMTGLVAKENIVATLAVIFLVSETTLSEPGLSNVIASVGGLSAIAGLSFIIFNLFTPPCFATIGAMNAELQSKRLLAYTIGFQLMMGYVLALGTYQIGYILSYRRFAPSIIPALGIIIGVAVLFMFLTRQARQGKGFAYGR
jgi:ferrous iron transport protein B